MIRKSVAVAVFGLLFATSANAQQGMNGCFLYSKNDMRGAQFSMGPNTSIADFASRRGWNDEISSAWVTPNCSMWLYEHSQFRGAGLFVTFTMHDLKRFNDRTSSARCECK